MNGLRNKRVILLAALLFLPLLFVCAQDSNVLSLSSQDEKAQLELQLKEIESQIAQYQQELGVIQGEKSTLQNKLKQMQNQQASILLQIKASNLKIAQTGDHLVETRTAIDESISRISRIQEQMAQLIRAINEYDNYSLIAILLAKDNFAEALSEIDGYSQISSGLNDLLNQTAQTKEELNREEEVLEQQQEEARALVSIKILQQQQLSGSVDEQNQLLQETKGRESSYQSILSDTQKKAAEIRNRLYQLIGAPTQITFGEAVQIAQWASGYTGVRAAFLLAVLTQESNLGKNIGTCNRSGDPPEKSWRVVMKPSRDQEPFLTITGELGLNPDVTPVSCPMKDSKGKQIGWGGAMGPAQFIPSTWMGYRERVSAITGKPANPWDIRDAFLASAIKLKNDGAGTVSGEWAAAMRYFSGSTNTKYRFYGDNVVALANQYQADIDSLNN